MFAAQNGVCAICGRPPKEGGKRLCVDHDHKRMYVRGLLCQHCNMFLMSWMDADWLRAALAYIERGDPGWASL